MKIPLSNRLLACCGFIKPGDRVADVGCDHGYLGIYLLKQGIASSVIASDVNQGPLQAALRNAHKFGVQENISFYLSDGVRNIPRDFDCMVCAGMGADTIISILENSGWLEEKRYRLILQCQSKRPELRKWLHDNGYRICRETLAKDRKFVYSIMEGVFDPGHKIEAWEIYISSQLLQDSSPLLGEYYDRVVNGVRLTLDGLRRVQSDQIPIYENILRDLTALEGQIHGNRT